MSINHKGVQCDACAEHDIIGVRYYCLVCENYDLCEDCYHDRRFSQKHKPYHPMQPIYPELEYTQCFNGKPPDDVRVFVCPYCGDGELNPGSLIKHCQRYHAEGGHSVRCPLCIFYKMNPQRYLSTTLAVHSLDLHKEYSASTVSPSTSGAQDGNSVEMIEQP